jgi:hypothetical protein
MAAPALIRQGSFACSTVTRDNGVRGANFVCELAHNATLLMNFLAGVLPAELKHDGLPAQYGCATYVR